MVKSEAYCALRLHLSEELKPFCEQFKPMQMTIALYGSDCSLLTFFLIGKSLVSLSPAGIRLHSCGIHRKTRHF